MSGEAYFATALILSHREAYDTLNVYLVANDIFTDLLIFLVL
jgi:hypothetical protein